MHKKLIDLMVDRFLGWKLPEDFNPDCGISFKRDYNEGTQWPMKHEPVGTNLLNAIQAKAMIEHLLPDIPKEILACLDDPSRAAALAVIAEALPDLLKLKAEFDVAPLGDANGGAREYRRLTDHLWSIISSAAQAAGEGMG